MGILLPLAGPRRTLPCQRMPTMRHEATNTHPTLAFLNHYIINRRRPWQHGREATAPKTHKNKLNHAIAAAL